MHKRRYLVKWIPNALTWQREKPALGGWASEHRLCMADRVLRIPPETEGARTLLHTLRFRVVFRTFFFNGETTGKFEIAIAEKSNAPSDEATTRQVIQALLDLPPHPDVRLVWLLNTYHSEQADLQLFLIGKNLSAITGYLMSWVRTAPGVVDTEMDTVLEWRFLANPDNIIELCEMFFTPNPRVAELK